MSLIDMLLNTVTRSKIRDLPVAIIGRITDLPDEVIRSIVIPRLYSFSQNTETGDYNIIMKQCLNSPVIAKLTLPKDSETALCAIFDTDANKRLTDDFSVDVKSLDNWLRLINLLIDVGERQAQTKEACAEGVIIET